MPTRSPQRRGDSVGGGRQFARSLAGILVVKNLGATAVSLRFYRPQQRHTPDVFEDECPWPDREACGPTGSSSSLISDAEMGDEHLVEVVPRDAIEV